MQLIALKNKILVLVVLEFSKPLKTSQRKHQCLDIESVDQARELVEQSSFNQNTLLVCPSCDSIVDS